jgi:hypothetical protein
VADHTLIQQLDDFRFKHALKPGRLRSSGRSTGLCSRMQKTDNDRGLNHWDNCVLVFENPQDGQEISVCERGPSA